MCYSCPQAHAYESCKPLGAWIRDLSLRVEFFAEWCELVIKAADKAIKLQNQQQQTSDTMVEEGVINLAKTQPRSFWLSSFFFPQGEYENIALLCLHTGQNIQNK